jgi:WD40 repeat protein
MKNTLMTFLAVLLIVGIANSQGGFFYRDKKLSSWGKVEVFNSDMINISFSIDEKCLAVLGHGNGSLAIWDLETGNIIHNLRDTTWETSYFIRAIDYSPDGKYLATVGSTVYWKTRIEDSNGMKTLIREGKIEERKVLRIYETSHYSITKEISYDTIAGVFSCVFSPDSKFLITGENQTIANEVSFLRVYETNTWQESSKYEIDFIPWEICLSNSGKQLYLGSNDGFLMIHDFSNGAIELNNKIKLTDNEISSLSISPDNQTISINQDSIFLYQLNSSERKFISYRKCGLYACSFSADKKLIAYGGLKNACTIYNLESNRIVQTLKGETDNKYENENNLTRPVFSKSGKIIALLNDAGMIYIYRYK